MIERFYTRRMFALFLGCAAVLTSLPAYAEESCTIRERDGRAAAKTTFHENLAGGGLHGDGRCCGSLGLCLRQARLL